MILHPTPDNPIPPGAIVRAVTTSDRAELRAAFWPARRGAGRGTVAIFQGHAEFIEKYAEVIGELLDRGFAVATFDWRGQGGSVRGLSHPRKSHVADFAFYRRDIAAFLSEILEQHCPKPWFGLGHSMGGAILAGFSGQTDLPFQRLVLVAPMLKIALKKYYGAARRLARVLRFAGLGRRFVPGGGPQPRYMVRFPGNPLTSDPRRYGRLANIIAAHPGLVVGAPTIGWLHAAFRFCARFEDPAFATRVRVPILAFACGDDRIVDRPTIEHFASHLKSGVQILIPHARHELLMERDVFREQFWAAFDAFVPGTRPLLSAPQADDQWANG